VSRVHPELRKKLATKLGLSESQVNRLIAEKANERFLPRPLAAIALAAESHISVTKYATPEDLLAIRTASGAAIVPSVSVPTGPASPRPRRPVTRAKKAEPRRGTSVFVVHGRDEKLRKALFAFLRSVGLNPIEWRQAIKLTGKPSPFVAEILDAAFREAVAVVVLLTPDDDARLRTTFVRSSDPEYEKRLAGQARPNVLFEAGLAFGRNPDQTVLVQVGDVKPFSDIAGRHLVRLTNSTETRQEFVTKLANAGCNVQTDGTDWHTEADFSL